MTIIAAIVVYVVVGAVGGLMVAGGAIGSGMLGNIASTSSGSSPSANEVQFDKNSPMGKLQEFGKAMEESNKKMEAAQKSGDANATAAAAMDTLGTLFGGGKKVDPLEIDQIKSFLPPTLAGFAKQGNGTAEKSGFASLMVSKAEAKYSDGVENRDRRDFRLRRGERPHGPRGLGDPANVEGRRQRIGTGDEGQRTPGPRADAEEWRR